MSIIAKIAEGFAVDSGLVGFHFRGVFRTCLSVL